MTKAELIKQLERYNDNAQIVVHIDNKKRNFQVNLFIYSEVYNEVTISFPITESANYLAKKRDIWGVKLGKAKTQPE